MVPPHRYIVRFAPHSLPLSWGLSEDIFVFTPKDMPPAKTKRQRREQAALDRERLLQAEQENATLREQLAHSRQRPASNAAPLYRQQIVA